MATGLGAPAPLVSPTNMYPRPPPPPAPYSYPTATTSAATPVSAHISSPITRRPDDDKESAQSQAPRQSLPSIHEALGNEHPLPYPNSSNGQPSQAPHHPPHPSLPSGLVSRSGEGPAGPPNPFSTSSGPSPYLREPSYHVQPGLPPQSQADVSRSSLASINSADSRKHSLPSLSSGKSPTQSSRTAATSISNSQNSVGYEYPGPTSTSAMQSPNGPGPYSQQYNYQPQSLNGQSSGGPYDSRNFVTPWKPGVMEASRVDDSRRGINSRPGFPGLPHSDSAKRHVDEYEVEMSLNEVGFPLP